ncbi:16316_t:CDS:1 [Funneliformis mosseae]|uniref:16316_t:CDS:1 n=1 Tax=Funneliformis mosseae TaxID=27381 RepID=A0A9N9FLZ5_FUNMO|nr:16316_t:CDS:1 [Funneliformis mosseae]
MFKTPLKNVIKPSFPPSLTKDVHLEKLRKSKKPKGRSPNAFILYRMELREEYLRKNIQLPPMNELSMIASNFWKEESTETKDYYVKLANDIKSLYTPNTFFVMDKHMKEINYNQRSINVSPSRATGVESGYDVNQTDQTTAPFEDRHSFSELIEVAPSSPKFYEHSGKSLADKELFELLDS